MRGLYLTSVTLHLLAAVYWLGGMWFLALVAAPVMRRDLGEAERGRLFQGVGRRFRLHGMLAFAVLLVTGLMNLSLRGWLRPEVLGAADFWASPLGHALAAKLGLVLLMFLLTGAHDSLLGAQTAPDASPERNERRRRAAVWLARGNAVIGLVIVYFAVRIVRGG